MVHLFAQNEDYALLHSILNNKKDILERHINICYVYTAAALKLDK